MYNVTITEKTISVRNEQTKEAFAIVLNNRKLETHRSIEGKGDKYAAQIQTAIRRTMARNISKKVAWAQRFNKVGKILNEVADSKTLHVMSNRFNMLLEQKFPMAA